MAEQGRNSDDLADYGEDNDDGDMYTDNQQKDRDLDDGNDSEGLEFA